MGRPVKSGQAEPHGPRCAPRRLYKGPSTSSTTATTTPGRVVAALPASCAAYQKFLGGVSNDREPLGLLRRHIELTPGAILLVCAPLSDTKAAVGVLSAVRVATGAHPCARRGRSALVANVRDWGGEALTLRTSARVSLATISGCPGDDGFTKVVL